MHLLSLLEYSNFDLSVGLEWQRTDETDADNIVGGDGIIPPKRADLHLLIGENSL